MSKKLNTIKEYLENRIAELEICKDDLSSADMLTVKYRIEELDTVLQVYNQQCKEILEAIGITQQNLNKVQVDYIGSKCIKFAEWVFKGDWEFSESLGDIWMNREQRAITSEGLYNAYTAQEARGETSTEDPSSSK